MKKKDLILKWLNNEQLTKQESEAFQQMDAFDSYRRIADTAKKIKPPSFDTEENLENLKSRLSDRKTTNQKNYFIVNLMRVAAIFVLGIGVYFSFFHQYTTTIATIAGEKTTIQLPDASIVALNAQSSIKYNKKNWVDQRSIALNGEAYFKVAKGEKFDVETTSGTVSVLGTQFNVKQREDYFEVTCYEGLVSVSYNDKVRKLSAGNRFTMIEGNIEETASTLLLPDWKNNRSSFTSVPFSQIIEEFERQYNVTIIAKNIDKTTLFTGIFVHSDIETALKSITIPMRLQYKIDTKNITLYRE
ncbi:FecR domain-containing protein [Aquimarina addita]|uniref:FecR domain-containing protein n=1 Tax=Aquimarina addita TaxID=870485 RepID=A0ABP7XDR7_9FLAO